MWKLLCTTLMFSGLALQISAQSTASAAKSTSSAPSTSAEPSAQRDDEPKPMQARIESGILTVDGMTAKVHLNYDVYAKYLYFYVPGMGTVIVAQGAFPGAQQQVSAFNGPSLDIAAGGHLIELTSTGRIMSKKPHDAWVKVDPTFRYPDRSPVMGYGNTLDAPYNWPSARASSVETRHASAHVAPPPVPGNMLPRLEAASAYFDVKPR